MPPEQAPPAALNSFELCLDQAVEWFNLNKPRRVTLVHHNDTDGLTAGTICTRMFDRAGVRLARYCLEKPYPQALERIIASVDEGELLVLTDLASGMLSNLAKINSRAVGVLVLDHHRAEAFTAPWLRLVNSTASGLDGTFDGSASAVAYRFALRLSQLNGDLKPLALLGAYGDGQFRSAADARGLNALHYFEPLEIGGHSFSEIKLGIDVLGSFAYFRGGSDIAVKILSDGLTTSSWSVVKQEVHNFEAERERFLSVCVLANNAALTTFSIEPAFADSGVKMVGLMCEELFARHKVAPTQYLLGFQELNDQIPGLGAVGLSGFKVSMRVGSERWQLIEQGKSPDVAAVLSIAANSVGGFVDGCHRHAGAVTIPRNEKTRFLAGVVAAISS